MSAGDGPGLVERYVRLVIRRRRRVLLVIAALTVLALLSLSQVVVASSFGRMFLGENPDYDAFLQLSARFGSDEVLVVGVEDPDFLTDEGQARLRGVTAKLAALKGVSQVRSVLDAFYLRPGTLLSPPVPVRYVDEARAHPERIPAFRERLRADPLVAGSLVGRDGASLAVLIQLTADSERKAEEAPQLVAAALDAFHAAYPPAQVHRAGMPALMAEMLRQILWALLVTTPVVALVLLATVWLLFGRLWPAAISLGVAAFAVVWSLGVAVLIDDELNIMMGAVPGVILIIAFSDIVHLCSAYLLELGAGHEQEEAIVSACSEVGSACLFTSLTTFTGFICLSLIPVPVFRVMGVVLGFGVGVALFLAVTLVPIVFSLLPAPKPLREGAAGSSQRVLDGLLDRCRRLATERPRSVVAAFALLTAAGAAGASQLRIETDFSARLSADNQVRADGRWFAERFQGSNVVQVYVTAPAPDALQDPAWVARLAAFQRAVAGLAQVEGATSLVDVLSAVYRATPFGQRRPAGALPEQPVLHRTLLGGLQQQAGPALSGLVDVEAGRLRMLVAVEGHAMRETARVARRIEALAGEHFGAETAVDATGLIPLFGDFLDVVVRAQQEGVLISIVTIALLMVLGLRSLRVGVLSMPPNLFPLLILAACLGVFWGEVDSDAISLTFVAIGIGVDDTIHFLIRFRVEARRGCSSAEAIERTFAYAGRGIAMTTVILAVGFLPFLLSDYFYMRMLGSLLPLCLVVALLADLLLVPAMAQLGWLRFAAGPASAADPA